MFLAGAHCICHSRGWDFWFDCQHFPEPRNSMADVRGLSVPAHRYFLNPASDPLGVGYHITQSKIVLGSGVTNAALCRGRNHG